MKKKDKIIFTGGSGKFGKVFRRIHQNKEILYPTSNQLDIKNYKSIKKYLSKFKPKSWALFIPKVLFPFGGYFK